MFTQRMERAALGDFSVFFVIFYAAKTGFLTPEKRAPSLGHGASPGA